nr:protein kinase [Pyrinomonadaceae bacterium]
MATSAALDDQPGHVIDALELEVAAQMLAEDYQSESLVGRLISHYKILALIGRGGMGEVYLAQDTKLKRSVALKLLLAELTRDEDRVRRFEQEACAASALNHPNILTIYEIGQTDFAHFIATEYIDGITLRAALTPPPLHLANEAAISNKQMKIGEVLDMAVQIASALVAAHGAGIVHRDIKPENIMVRADALVKVLDFGLAKLTEEQSSAVNTEASTKRVFNTAQGVVLGTPRYMSPEQARGLPVNARTDIWSFGCVLYEMVAGCAPFEGATVSDQIAAVLEREPLPLVRYREEVPAELQRIISKALRKDKEERYQTIQDMAVDLRSLKQELEFEAKLERTTQPYSSGGRSLARSDSQRAVGTAAEITALTRAVETSRTGTSSAEYLVSEIKRHKRGAMIAFITLVISGISFGLYKLINANKPAAPSFETMKIAKLSFTGKATNAAISLDGRYVVHTVDEGGEQSLWIRQVATLSTVKIVPPAEVVYRGATFSPDGDYVYYVMFERNNLVTTLYQVPVLGGTPRRVIDGVDSVVTFSPDGKHLAFVRNYADWEETALIVANTDGTGEQKLATRKQPDSLKRGNAIGPAWSPDGKTIACVVRGFAGGSSDTVIEVEVEGGAEKSLTSQRWSNAGQVAWLGNGSGLIIAAAAEQSSGVSQLWYVSRQGGRVHRVTNDPNSYQGVSLTKDFSTLATVQSERISDVWVASMENSSRATQITSGSGKSAASWTSDGRIVYSSNAGGNDDVWMMNADGTDQKQLTTHPGADRHPSVCSGGRYVVFTYERAGSSNIWRMDLNGGNLKQLTNGRSERFPLCSPDGQWVIFQNGTNKGSASKVSIDG